MEGKDVIVHVKVVYPYLISHLIFYVFVMHHYFDQRPSLTQMWNYVSIKTLWGVCIEKVLFLSCRYFLDESMGVKVDSYLNFMPKICKGIEAVVLHKKFTCEKLDSLLNNGARRKMVCLRCTTNYVNHFFVHDHILTLRKVRSIMFQVFISYQWQLTKTKTWKGIWVTKDKFLCIKFSCIQLIRHFDFNNSIIRIV